LNGYRAMGKLGAVTEDPALSSRDALHATYIVEADDYEHAEHPEKAGYSAAGDDAAKNSVLAASTTPLTFKDDIDEWMQAPLHALPILDPRLARVGFAEFSAAPNSKGGIVHAAALDVNHGVDWVHPARFPAVWPADGAVVPLNHHWGETPQVVQACPGYALPTGLPLYVLLGDGTAPSAPVTSHALTTDGAPVEHCVFDENTVRLPDANDQVVAEKVLHARNAVILIPRAPLTAGAKYQVAIEAGVSLAWSFTVDLHPRATP
jgi:hypothetical protein